MKLYQLSLILFLYTFWVSNCKKEKDISSKNDTNNINLMDSNWNVSVDTNCLLTQNIKCGIEQINKGPNDFNKKFGNNDNCYLSFLDSLTNRFVKTSDDLYMVALDSLAVVSDGYVAEYFTGVTQELSEENFIPFFNYLYSNGKTIKDRLLLLYVESIAFQIEEDMERGEYNTRKDLEKTLMNKLKTKEFKKEELKFLKNIFKQVDEYMKKH